MDLFISDLHLDPARPAITRLFLEFLRGEARGAGRLFILGDLFEAWIGDDAGGETGDAAAAGLAELQRAGVPVYLMHGNRDFLVGDAWARRAGVTLLPDPCVLDIAGTATLLMHGDTLCTDDAAYQEFRAQSRSPAWQRGFLVRGVAEREQFAAMARAESARYTKSVDLAITDVNQAAVEAAMRAHGVARLIHGHTHRPAVHRFELEGKPVERIVLGDWYEQGSVLRVEESGFELSALPLVAAAAPG